MFIYMYIHMYAYIYIYILYTYITLADEGGHELGAKVCAPAEELVVVKLNLVLVSCSKPISTYLN
jgi:hypothetical protein